MQLYTIQAIYTDQTDNATKIYTRKNMDAVTLIKFRKEVFQGGLFIPNDPYNVIDGKIISPFDIRVIEIVLQDKQH